MTKRLAFFFAMIGLPACGSGSLGGTSPVITSDVLNVMFQSTGGGLRQPPPSGAGCDPAVWQYFITIATRDVSWTGCIVSGPATDPASYAPQVVDHPLDAATWSGVSDALNALTTSAATSCGADLDFRTLTVERANDDFVTYGDDFYACQKEYARYVTSASLDNLATTLSALP